MAGRNLVISDGGSLTFEEAQETGVFTATIVVDNLTANRTIRIPDQDGTLTGLAPGEVWKVNQGGTGRGTVAANSILAGGDANTLKLVEVPTQHNTFLFWDGVLGQFHWAPVEYQANVTTARNIGTQAAGLYSHNVGSEMQFRNLLGSNGITVTQNPADVTFSINPDSLNVKANNFTGLLTVDKGGTGRQGWQANELLMGTGSLSNNATALKPVNAPTATGQYLIWDGTAIAWNTITYTDSLPGHLEYPQAKTYMLNVRWPFAARITGIFGYVVPANTGASGANYILFVAGGNVVNGSFGATRPSAVTAVSTPISVGDEIKLSISNVNNVADLYFVINYTR